MIRRAKLSDLYSLNQYGEFFWTKSPYYGHIPYNAEAVTELLRTMITDHYLIVATEGAQINGFLGLLIAPLIFNPNYMTATELFFFVRPSKRGMGFSAQLIEQAEDELKDVIDIISFGDMSTSTDMDRYYKSRGYAQTERSYSKVL
jgi:GNAT superfamily N-acetyltransferase